FFRAKGLAAVVLDSPPVDDQFGPVILALRAEQWVGPPCTGAFLVLLGVYMRDWSEPLRAVLRFVGWVTVATTVFAFGLAGLWAPTMQMIFVYSLTTPLFVVPMVKLGWRDVRAAMEVRHV
ncbi:MAG: hypothetical protein EBT13_07200, partial [Rhodobacteraceae bacterium]|nr:hypothetical protein [Paracoccaceae bacterium]